MKPKFALNKLELLRDAKRSLVSAWGLIFASIVTVYTVTF